MRFYPLFTALVLLLIGSYTPLSAQQTSETTDSTIFNWLYTGTDSILEVRIETDMRLMLRQKFKEEYQKAKYSMVRPDGESMQFEIKVRARGNRRKEVCFYPPLKLKFKKSDLAKKGFLPYNDLKFVTQCRDTKTCGYYVFKEYLAYKLYNMISPNSFRVQLLKVSFVDSRGKGKTREMYGFIIEPVEEMADRLNAAEIVRKTMRSSFMQLEPNQKMGIFQYMIGNTDWAIGNSHNLKFLKVPEYGRMVPVPYDFDYSGLVHTDYAVPFHTLPIEEVTERLYRGVECTESEIPGLIEFYQNLKDPIMDYVEDFPHFNSNTRREVTQYLEEFFETFESPKAVQRIIGSD